MPSLRGWPSWPRRASPPPSAPGCAACARFCRWLVTEGELEKAPTDGIEIPDPPEKPVPILTDEEVAALLKACAVGRGRPGIFRRPVFLGRGQEVVLRLLLDTGVRM